MKRNHTLSAAMALTLSVCPLFAQDNPPTPPQRPAQPPQREGEPRRDGHRGGDAQRHAPGLFGALDANRDGAIDQTELGKALDVLRSFDRNGDGRILPGEMHPQGGGEKRGPREPGKQAEGRRDQSARGEGRGDGPRREGARPEGDRAPRPEGEARREGDRPRNASPAGPRAEGPRDDQQSPGGPRDQRDGEVKREGPKGPPPGNAPQAQAREHRPGPGMRNEQNRFTQQPRPDFGRGGQRPPRAPGATKPNGGQNGPMAMGPRTDPRQGAGRMEGREGGGQREFHHDLGARGPQAGSGQFHPQGPGQMQRPNSDGPQRPDMGKPQPPEGMRDGRGERGPREDRDGRPQGPRPPDVQ